MMKTCTNPLIFCLMGPTAAGKTALSLELIEHFPFEIVSVDSAMVYKGLDIGTAKPDAKILKTIPHHLINLLDPKEIYSAGQFQKDAYQVINAILKRGKLPLLVGGTMLYFHSLIKGISPLPSANQAIREHLQIEANQWGWPKLHADLAKIDHKAAQKIAPFDAQRIQRAFEVYLLTGKPITSLQQREKNVFAHYKFSCMGIFPTDRNILHERIKIRLETMLAQGFLEEVTHLYQRGDLSPTLPAIRTIGYRQIWDYLSHPINYQETKEKILSATRQLAKRQLTWMKSWPNLYFIDLSTPFTEIKHFISAKLP